ncbi:hypothetical protein [Sinorhizobium meliloti]|uniref:hypothetical protein n=1 Tax=Rhizobium meliloti TaxID=382 RepID=UPI000FD8B8C6|nr:hypothetical protein [Sinorhizobium meliloti]RVK17015.1 hypothetical protein CN164_03675 [Sinorhizobium meliloti]
MSAGMPSKSMMVTQPQALSLVGGLEAPSSTTFLGSSQSQSAFASLLASLISAKELSSLTVEEYNLLIAMLAGEVMTNPAIHAALKARAAAALAELRA